MWLKLWCPRNNIKLADVWQNLVTANSDTLISGYDSGDAIHPETQGHQKIAEAFATAFGTLHYAINLANGANTLNLVSNPYFYSATTGWYEQPGQSTGGSVTYSRVADSSGKLSYGSWLQMDFNTSSSAGVRYYCTAVSGLTAGNTYLLTARTDYNDVSGGFYANAIGAGITSDYALDIRKYSNFTIMATSFSTSVKPAGAVMTKFVLPVGETQAVIAFRGKLASSLNVQFRIGEVGLFDITSLSNIASLL
jgi:hypothetical protein